MPFSWWNPWFYQSDQTYGQEQFLVLFVLIQTQLFWAPVKNFPSVSLSPAASLSDSKAVFPNIFSVYSKAHSNQRKELKQQIPYIIWSYQNFILGSLRNLCSTQTPLSFGWKRQIALLHSLSLSPSVRLSVSSSYRLFRLFLLGLLLTIVGPLTIGLWPWKNSCVIHGWYLGRE